MSTTYSAIFAILVGAGMIGQWTRSLLAGQVPELEHEPIRMRFHLAAELATAACLILGGVGVWMKIGWGRPLFLVAMGMLFYTAIVSPGYFAQHGDWRWLGVFLTLILLGLAGILQVI